MTTIDDLAHRLLGTILVNPAAAELAIMLVGPARWLHPWPNADTVAIARAIQQIALRGDLPDPLTVADHLGDHPAAATLLPDLPRLAEAANLVPQRAEELRRHALLLSARMTIDGFAHRITDPEADPVALSQELIARISEYATAGSRERSVSTLAHELIAQYDAIRDGTRPDGLKLTHPILDTLLGGGLPYGRMTILGARPSEGKTSLLCNWIDLTLRIHHPVAVFTFDDDPELFLMRLACIHAGICFASARSGTLRPKTEARYKAAYQWLIDSPLEIISDHNLSPLACRADLLDIARHYLPDLTERGGADSCPCPFHNGTGNSFKINPKRGQWRCWSTCDIGGDVLDLIARYHNLDSRADYHQCIEILAERLNIPVQYTTSPGPTPTGPTRADLHAALAAAHAHYQANLQDHPEALAYLTGRGFTRELIKAWALGYARGNSVLTLETPEDHQLAAAIIQRGKKSGDLYDPLRARITIP
jgi:hypothetical protein